MLRILRRILVVSALAASSAALAGVSDVTPALRQQAEAICKDDALRLCAESIEDESAIVACMRPKRSELTAPCRKVFDQVLRAVNR